MAGQDRFVGVVGLRLGAVGLCLGALLGLLGTAGARRRRGALAAARVGGATGAIGGRVDTRGPSRIGSRL